MLLMKKMSLKKKDKDSMDCLKKPKRLSMIIDLFWSTEKEEESGTEF